MRRGTESQAIFSALTSYGLLGVSEGRDPWKSSAACVRLETPSVSPSTPRARAQYVAQKRVYRRVSVQQTSGKYLLHSSVTMNEKEMSASAPETVAREKPPQAAAPLKAQLSQRSSSTQFFADTSTTVFEMSRYPFPQLTPASKQHQNICRQNRSVTH